MPGLRGQVGSDVPVAQHGRPNEFVMGPRREPGLSLLLYPPLETLWGQRGGQEVTVHGEKNQKRDKLQNKHV